MTNDATASTRLPLTIGDLTDLVSDHADGNAVSIRVQFTYEGEPAYVYPIDAFLTIHHSGLVELTIDLDLSL